MMKKVIFALLLGLSLAQVSPVDAAESKLGKILKNKGVRTALYVGIAATAALCGVEAVSYANVEAQYKANKALSAREKKESNGIIYNYCVEKGKIYPKSLIGILLTKNKKDFVLHRGRFRNSLDGDKLLKAAKFLVGEWAFTDEDGDVEFDFVSYEGAKINWTNTLKTFGKLVGVVAIDAAVITALVALGDVIIRSDKALAVTLLKKCFGSKKTAKAAV